MTNAGGVSRYSELSDLEVAKGFWGGEVPGQILMQRLLARIDLADRAQEPLVRRSGEPIYNQDGEVVLAQDYVDLAEGHPGAIDTMVGFVAMDPSSAQYEESRTAIASMVNGYLAKKD